VFHPQVDPRFEGDARVRYVYMSYCNDDGVSGSTPIGWMRWDRTTGEERKWVAPPGCFCEEVVVIPKARGGGGGGGDAAGAAASPRPEEDTADAWVAAMMFDSNRDASCLCVLDAARFDEGPVAKLWLRHHVPHGLHGCWEPEALHGLE
jgi:all-trans-8'-apo-beta-carotenal 15,15'-oxygenase